MITHMKLLYMAGTHYNTINELIHLKEVCCESLVRAFLNGSLFISGAIHDQQVTITNRDGNYISVAYCPYCGAKLEIIEDDQAI